MQGTPDACFNSEGSGFTEEARVDGGGTHKVMEHSLTFMAFLVDG